METNTTPRKPGRPAGTPKTGGKPPNAREYTCPICETVFTRPASRVVNDEPACSVECAAALRSEGRTITLPCSYCGKDVTKPVSKVSASGVIYCDKTCWASRSGN